MHKTPGALLEKSQDVLSTQILYTAFKKQDSECPSLKKKKGKCDKEYVERHSKSLHQRERDKNF